MGSPVFDVHDTARCKVAQYGSITVAGFDIEAELNSKIQASALCSQLLISNMLGSISLAPYLSRSPGLVVLGNVPFDVHQEVWIIEARLNAKTLASALAFSALHGCLRH